MPFQVLNATFTSKDAIPPNEPFEKKNTRCQKKNDKKKEKKEGKMRSGENLCSLAHALSCN